ncbi:MAG: patatin-like phospholipase family protein [Nanoarchaeota archaeon]|nr:patatin-like phospholipase family protein [Nanoarchaeota archaeon]
MAAQSYKFKNLVFEGGGVKGIAYAGALEFLEKNKILENIQRVGGTSAGAITAALLAVGFSSQEIKNELEKANFNTFKDDSFFLINIFRLLSRYGWYKGNSFEKWLKKTISKKVKSDITFSELYNLKGKNKTKELHIIGTDINYKTHVILSHETVPDMSIVDAVRISMSIPLFFQAIKYKKSLYVDGGVYYNYPINLFDKIKYLSENKTISQDEAYIYNKETLGFRVDDPEEINNQIKKEPLPSLEVNSLQSYIQALIGGLIDFANKTHLNEEDWHRTIYIKSLGISSTEFEITKEQKNQLIKSGLEGAKTYFNWFDKTKGDNRPLNK